MKYSPPIRLLGLAILLAAPLPAFAQEASITELQDQLRQAVAKQDAAADRMEGSVDKFVDVSERLISALEKFEGRLEPGPSLVAEKRATPAAGPPLTIYLSDQKTCKPGEAAERELLWHLSQGNWKYGKNYQIVRDDDRPCPSFEWKGKAFSEDGWPGWPTFRQRLAAVSGLAMPVPATAAVQAAVTLPAASVAGVAPPLASNGIVLNPGERLLSIEGRPVGTVRPYSTPIVGSCPEGGCPGTMYCAPVTQSFQYSYRSQRSSSVSPARRTWHMNGGESPASLARHLRQSHGIDPAGMTYQDMINAHSHAHEGTWSAARSSGYSRPVARSARRVMMSPVRMVGRVLSGGCPSGGCP